MQDSIHISSMRKLDNKSRALIIRLLVEGSPIRSMWRIADVSKNKGNKLLIDAGTLFRVASYALLIA